MLTFLLVLAFVWAAVLILMLAFCVAAGRADRAGRRAPAPERVSERPAVVARGAATMPTPAAVG